MTYNVNETNSLNSFEALSFEAPFKEIKAEADIDEAIQTGENFGKFQEASLGHRNRLTYLDIAHVVHGVRSMMADPALAPVIRDRCTKANISIWQEGKDPVKKKPANLFQAYVTLLRGTASNEPETKDLNSTWKNNLRVVRHLIEEKVPAEQIVDYIETAETTVDGEIHTKLEALRQKDRVKHPSKTKPSKSFTESKPFAKAEKARGVGKISGLTVRLASHHGYGLVLVRGENDNFDVVNAVEDEAMVQMVIRKLFG